MTSTIVLTGGTSGIGREAAIRLAEGGAEVAVVGRDADRGRELADTESAGEIRFYEADLGTQAAVRSLAAALRSQYDSIDVLAHNAGTCSPTRTETADGVELTLAVNHAAPYLLTHELIGRLRANTSSRIVLTMSHLHRLGELAFDDLQMRSAYDWVDAYARAELANVVFIAELAERLDPSDVTANCFHPGFVPGTNIVRNVPWWRKVLARVADILPFWGVDVGTAANRLVSLATDPSFETRSGRYYRDDAPAELPPEAQDPAVRQRVWETTASVVGVDAEWP
ncbi:MULTISPECIES: SDR family NAD(P)-dependent oxidoreductase [Halomicrobium]|uniref:Short-chain dehydrogenase/reductase SDR n=2 Tax=Halomicrobium mukohataei TaxID=57705 RepID=C7P0L6_HALMD|nr:MULTISPECIES: SDR family NAD(P)-dependent oxidoreductase [Halomicrobium]ACV46998.1 short-chain dehydrogenase/reductase SDR [Halomicrobium mukohataei DSM 12286]QCD65492.1 SDR family NAD(P)-dependent oxidoreductase [Halomicrobium mukohataei]QFR20298.1 SDR family NAD(P)-dependent oxidoreductase [Halomicrobium sp. ZPS1]